jgi:hypothetical protein
MAQSTGLVLFGIFIIFMEFIAFIVSGLNTFFFHQTSTTMLIFGFMSTYWAFVMAFALACIFSGAFNIHYFLFILIIFEILALLYYVGWL